MHDNSNELLKFQAICTQSGVRLTPQRIELYHLLVNNKTHPSADKLYQLLHQSHPTISFNTVFTSLQLFVKLGLIKETESYDGVKRYDSNIDEHGHFHCTRCGKIIDFDISEIDSVIPKELEQKHQVNHKKILLEGFCFECREIKQ